ncbi:hypothetical protein JRO89_XS03G0043800 [Xanthoceras sorbifolium]|uniref:Uncharacterized protein n=1 Tax=Xanthoceras sorbifolium TaxID=99658 RepID=A0ABQ8I8L3_9ROSI|nr:hypothetical protein JRO89_XS03G0043800 [Xanthoceras sorbifolium]
MAHSLTTPPPPSTTCTTPISINSRPSIAFQRVSTSHQSCKQVSTTRRFVISAYLASNGLVYLWNVSLGLVGAVLGLNVVGGDAKAYAPRKRPPPPPARERKDPNMSDLQAKLLASKKRKEEMKQAAAKLREKGKAINEPSD